jgi:hypothetical protein
LRGHDKDSGGRNFSRRFAVFAAARVWFYAKRKRDMRLSILAGLMIAVMTLPAGAAQPVKGAVKGTATAATGVAKGTVQAGRGIARGTLTAARGVGRGARCVFTLGNRC